MRVLIVKTSSLGDIVHTYPVISYLKAKYPTCTIDWVVESRCAELVSSHPLVDHVIKIDTRKLNEFSSFRKDIQQNSYDVVFDLQGNIKSGIVTWLARSPVKVGFDYGSVSEWPNVLMTTHRYGLLPGWNIREDYLSIIQQHFSDESSFTPEPCLLKSEEVSLNIPVDLSQCIMVCPGARWTNKQLEVDSLLRLLGGLENKGHWLFVWGNEEEKVLCSRLQQAFSDCSSVLERVPLPVLQNLMASVKLVVGMDSLPLHLAGSAGVPTVGVFGPSLGAKYAPLGDGHRVVQGECPYGRTFEKRCPVLRTCKTGACMRRCKKLE